MDLGRLKDLVQIVGKQRLVLDLSCRKKVKMDPFLFLTRVKLVLEKVHAGKKN